MAAQNPGVCNKNTKKKSIEKSYLDNFYGLKNVRNRSSMLELLFLVIKNNSELLLSPETGQFQVEEVFVTTVRISLGNTRKLSKFDLLNFKLTYLRAQEEFESVLEHYK